MITPKWQNPRTPSFNGHLSSPMHHTTLPLPQANGLSCILLPCLISYPAPLTKNRLCSFLSSTTPIQTALSPFLLIILPSRNGSHSLFPLSTNDVISVPTSVKTVASRDSKKEEEIFHIPACSAELVSVPTILHKVSLGFLDFSHFQFSRYGNHTHLPAVRDLETPLNDTQAPVSTQFPCNAATSQPRSQSFSLEEKQQKKDALWNLTIVLHLWK